MIAGSSRIGERESRSLDRRRLYILNDSLISSSAAESSDAGVVRLNVDEALVFESFVIASSQGGFAGEVTVLGDSILALNSDFAAESSLGVKYNGSVQISNLIDPEFLYNTLPLYVGIADQPFTQSCSMTTGDSLLFDIRLRKYEQEGVRFDEIWFLEGAHSPSSYPSQSKKMEAIRWEYDDISATLSHLIFIDDSLSTYLKIVSLIHKYELSKLC